MSSAQGCISPSPSKIPSASGLEHIKLYLLDWVGSWLKPTGVRLPGTDRSASARPLHRAQAPALSAPGCSLFSGWLLMVLELTSVPLVSHSGTGCPQPRRPMASK